MTFAKSLMKNKRSVLEDIFKVLIKFYYFNFCCLNIFRILHKTAFSLLIFVSAVFFSGRYIEMGPFIFRTLMNLFSFFFSFFFFFEN